MSRFTGRFPSAWTPEQIAFFDAHYETRGGTWVARQLGIPRQRVHQRAHRLGLKVRRRPRGICHCGGHSWLAISGGLVTLLDAVDFPIIAEGEWSKSAAGYAAARGVYLHRLIARAPADLVVDHLNGDRVDNRRCNLRVCPQIVNMQNMRTQPGKSGFRGVSRGRGRIAHKWTAGFRQNGKWIHVGTFATAEAAARAYDAAVVAIRGPHVATNFPLEVAA